MKSNKYILITKAIFSRWSGKSYAMFASLHKVVNIATIKIDMCNSAGLKHKSLVHFIKLAIISLLGKENNDEEKLKLEDLILMYLIESGKVNAGKVIPSGYPIICNKQKSICCLG